MFDIFISKVPVTYTENIEQNGVKKENTYCIGYLYTPNILASMQEQKKIVDELLKK